MNNPVEWHFLLFVRILSLGNGLFIFIKFTHTLCTDLFLIVVHGIIFFINFIIPLDQYKIIHGTCSLDYPQEIVIFHSLLKLLVWWHYKISFRVSCKKHVLSPMIGLSPVFCVVFENERKF